MNREQWLTEATERMRALFSEHGGTIPEKIRVSVGFPSKGAVSTRNQTIGQCWSPSAASDGIAQVFVSPVLGDGLRALDVLAHELVHAAVGTLCGHKGAFKRLATAIGLTGKMTATVAGEALKARLQAIIAEIGEYPHAALNPDAGRKKQSTRMLKLVCAEGHILRATRKVIDEAGLPTCGCGSLTEVSGGDSE